MSRRELIQSVYRSLLRWGRHFDRVPIAVKRDDLKLVSPALAEAKLSIQDGSSFRNAVRWNFRQSLATTDETENREDLTRALTAYKILNTTYAQQIAELETKRKEHSNLTGISFLIGQVVKHMEHGYRGVIYGWDRVCQHPQYCANPNIDLVQPFYSIIPDENDAIRAFGGPRMLQYAAQEEIEIVQSPFKISNRSILTHFESYSPNLGRYIPKRSLRFEYPGYYVDDEVQPCGDAESSLSKAALDDSEAKRCRRKRPVTKSGLRFKHLQSHQSYDPSDHESGDFSKVEGSDTVTP